MRTRYVLALCTALVPGLAAPLLLVPGTAHAQAAQAAQPTAATITVNGEGVVQAAPDMATLSIGVTTQNPTATEALAANTAAMDGVLARLKAAGVADSDLQTSNLSVNPNFTGYDAGAAPTISSYIAVNQLNVRIKALDTLGTVLDAAVSDGANTLNGLTFGLIDPKPTMDAARKAAVADAIARATLLVEASGGKLGRVVSISEGGGYSVPQPMFRADAASSPVPVAQGEVGVTAMVTVVFEIMQ